MKNSRASVPVLVFVGAVAFAGTAMADGLEGFLDEVEVRASTDMGSFRADLRLTFDVSDRTLDGLFEVLRHPSDVYMCLRIGEVARQPIDRVVTERQRLKGQGWGVVAQSLGIKPGSAEFHALKEGRLPANGKGGSSGKKSRGKNKP